MKICYFIIALFLSISLRAQTSKTEDAYVKEIQKITQLKNVRNAFDIIDSLEPITQKEHILLTEIPAPPFKEAARAARFKQMLEEAGADKVWIDSLGNVLALRKGKKPT